ncbi:MAG TPA: M15 family peptidase [Rhodobacteraceae bacterium]|nr:M15 family peptidase [Paracoccaceae bacterium]
MPYHLGERSRRNLRDVNPDLVAVVEMAIRISKVDFTVIEGRRTLARQKQLLKSGATRTLRSRHLTGHAVDLAPWVDGAIRWDWPLFYPIARAMKQAAKDQNVALRWGGDWKRFRDGPHFQLKWKYYPA